MGTSTEYSEGSHNYNLVARAIEYITAEKLNHPGLDELAEHMGLSRFHTQRLFSEWAGVTPKQFLQFLTKEHAKRCLKESSVLDSSFSSGLSGPSRLHDLMITYEGMTPGEYRSGGEQLVITCGVHPSPFGYCHMASTQRGICKLSFSDRSGNMSDKLFFEEIKAEWPLAQITKNDSEVGKIVTQIFTGHKDRRIPLHLLMKGSRFKLKVWEALLSIPPGDLVSYQNIAEIIDSPLSVRAVASAVAQNRIGYLIPCHRVIRKNGEFGNYRWGTTRKKAIIGWERGHSSTAI